MRKTLLILAAAVIFLATAAMTSVEKKWLNNGHNFYRAKMYDKAIESYDFVLKQNPRNYEALVYNGFCYKELGRNDIALSYFEKADSVNPSRKLAGIIESMKKQRVSVTKGYLYTGGLGRLYALGNPRVVLPDNASIVDGYDLGFTSAYVFRPRKNMINLAAGAGISSYKSAGKDTNPVTSEASGFSALLDNIEERHNSVAVWPIENMAVIIKPYFGYGNGTRSTSLSGSDPDVQKLSGMAYGAEVESSQRINENFAIGALLGFYATADTRTNEATGGRTGAELSKFEYLLSGSFIQPVRENSVIFSVSLGSRAPLLDKKLYLIQRYLPLDYRYYSTFYSHYNNKDWYESESPGAVTKGYTQWTTSAFDIGFGFGFETPGRAEFAAKFILTPSLSVKEASNTEVTVKSTGEVFNYPGEKEIAGSGSNTNLELRGRLFFDALVIGLMIKNIGMYHRFAESMTGETKEVKMAAFDAAGGVTFKFPANFNTPLELFYQSGTWEGPDSAVKMNFDTLGVRLGTEYLLGGGTALRLGGDYAKGGNRDVRTYGYDNGPYGTDINPAKIITGINAGFGFTAGSIETDVAARHAMYSESPNYRDIEEYGETETSLILSFRMGL